MKLLHGILGMLLTCLSLAFIAPMQPANATSVYDDTFVIGSLELSCGTSGLHSFTWREIKSTLRGHNSTFDDAFDSAILADKYTVYQSFDAPSSTAYDISVLVSISTSPQAFFYDWGTVTGLYVPGAMRGSVMCSGVDSSNAPILTTNFNTSIGSMRDFGNKSSTYNQGPVFSAMPVDYPTGYEGLIVPTEFPSSKYVAMGDSFSSGEGNPAFEYETDEAYVNMCHRSPKAYPRLLQNDSTLNLDSIAFVACSGATTDDVLGNAEITDPEGKWGESTQTDAINADTKLVTISVGGNDIEFGAFAEACFYGSCSQTSDEYETSWDTMTDDTRDDYLPDALAGVYEEIATKLESSNTDAQVLVLGYPHIVTYQSYLDDVGASPRNCLYMTGADAFAAEALVDKLNLVIETAVDNLGDSRFEFVDPTESILTDFPDHTLCGSDSWFNGVDLAHHEYTFHPNEEGQTAFKNLLAAKLD